MNSEFSCKVGCDEEDKLVGDGLKLFTQQATVLLLRLIFLQINKNSKVFKVYFYSLVTYRFSYV